MTMRMALLTSIDEYMNKMPCALHGISHRSNRIFATGEDAVVFLWKYGVVNFLIMKRLLR